MPRVRAAAIPARAVLNVETLNLFSLARVALSRNNPGRSSGLLLAGSLWTAQARQVDIHDPAMAEEGDTYYLFSSGPGITFYSSKDMKTWKLRGRVFPG